MQASSLYVDADRLGDLVRQAAGRSIPVTGSWGATETAPSVTTAHSGGACDA